MLRHRFHRLVLSTAAALAVVGGSGCDKTTPPPGDPAATPAAEPPAGTPETPSTPGADARALVVPAGHALHGRFEGEGLPNDCAADSDCHASGCSGEVCSAEPEAVTTCDVLAVSLPEGSQCGCVRSTCQWWSPSGATLAAAPAPTTIPAATPEPSPGATPSPKVTPPAETKPSSGAEPSPGAESSPTAKTCDGKPCAAPRECIEYYGIAGPRGPKFYACEIRCNPTKKGGCPDGMSCKTVADGPGPVCR